MSLRDEILEQPDVLERLLERQRPHIQEVARAIRQREIDYVFLMG